MYHIIYIIKNKDYKMKKFIMTCGNDCGAFTKSVADVAIWTKEDMSIVWDDLTVAPERWINIMFTTKAGRYGDEIVDVAIENQMDIQYVKAIHHWDDQYDILDIDSFRAEVAKVAVEQSDMVGMYNG